ncbi:MAG: glycosyl hydrolase family 28 protein [Kiritimatiellia bacterium]
MKKAWIAVAACVTLAFGARGAVVSGLGGDAAANRALIQRAVDAASAGGGGRVEIPAGVWTTGSIELKSGVELHLAKGATLRGSVDKKDYNANDAFPDNVWSVGEEWSGGHLVWAWRAANIAITGEGTIDGNGPAFFGECDEDSRFPWYKFGLKLHPLDREWFRPGMMVAFFRCTGIRLADVSLVNPPSWTCHIRCCDGVDIRGVRIEADVTIANSDGFSIDCTRNVKVEKCVLRTGDDGFAIRAACRKHAATNFCENIEIRDCDITSCCYGIRFGIGSGTIRNIKVLDTRVHAASLAGVGFSPAYVQGVRNCYIEDILVKNCTVAECEKAVNVNTDVASDWKVTGIRFEDCTFETLLPMRLRGGERCELAFRNCERRPIERLKVRHRLGWREREIRNKRMVFAEVAGDKGRITIENCRPLPFGSTGVLVLSFDDRNFADWERAIPIFEKYGAHATFFVSGDFTPDATFAAKKLMGAGHSIGLHGQYHGNVPEVIAQKGWAGYCAAELDAVKRKCDVAYIPVRNFAYPNSRRDETTDKHLLTRFDRLRTGIRGIRPYDPKGEKRAELKPLISDERLFSPVAELPRRRLLSCLLLGEAYNTDIEEVVACIRRAGARKEALVLASHGIHPDAHGIHLKTEWLERILAAAREAGVAVLGFDEIPLR